MICLCSFFRDILNDSIFLIPIHKLKIIPFLAADDNPGCILQYKGLYCFFLLFSSIRIQRFKNIHIRTAFFPVEPLQLPFTIMYIHAFTSCTLFQNRRKWIVHSVQIGPASREGIFTVYLLSIRIFRCHSSESFSPDTGIDAVQKILTVYLLLSTHLIPADTYCCFINIRIIWSAACIFRCKFLYMRNIISIIITILNLHTGMTVIIIFVWCFSVTSNRLDRVDLIHLFLAAWQFYVSITVGYDRCRSITHFSIMFSCISRIIRETEDMISQ